MARSMLMPLVLCAALAAVLLHSVSNFVPAPQTAQLRGAQQVALSTGMALMTQAEAAHALLVQETAPQSREEYYGRIKDAAAVAFALAAFLVFFIISTTKRVVENKWLN
eukprot:CAMPEP_0197652748 /NCGR_PEP_ID=MMETSP1338-20131121/34641_1 /TAXON_ID=43686 ORGANISM="Pelagodinium beii, Strain RCC1491" /NCGR_SAMPLE_ID=MMETSP1338 /ASSEMBLY_ACC=CAM_ASM_000754 /LENGTH=108 /DNA_ID=CAMNT_0043227689 /DNA_START=71 /DNA_END=397 /DNA_ORIENTATION=+